MSRNLEEGRSGRHLKDNNIILNMNLLPFEALDQVSNPAGIRLGVQEMTRFGMKEPEDGDHCPSLQEVPDRRKVCGDEVTEFRKNFQKVHFCLIT